ncbi:hypothetical protein AOQ84DRAFT_354101 [Glonium stellatum]|uniref:Uncharacterized protein n=1 Tax=Glonium stellatum TaxID=574774 RepID=A0A8E2JTR1_9PEZI|nr:hypothetical protein AOQ84DRAFT_354101 [Glonium stellatum]
MEFAGSVQTLQLNIVGFLAILGEGSILTNAQVSTLSRWSFAPRLLPAPQALMRPSRPSKLTSSRGRVTGVHSGNDRDHINHIGNIVINAESMREFSVRCVEIIRVSETPVKAKTLAPLTAVAMLGCTMSIVLVALSIYWEDGMALVAIILLSLLSTFIGLANKWTLHLPKRLATNPMVPPGDVVIRYPKGSFLIVKCTEDVARELFFAPENINYLVPHPAVYRIISLISTILLMFGIIALGNAGNNLQLAFAAAYILLNAGYWTVAALPTKLHWDTSCFQVKMQRLEGSEKNKYFADQNSTFTRALWKVIVVTKSIDWIARSTAAPDTDAWRRWLRDAKAAAEKEGWYEDPADGTLVWKVPQWHPQERLRELLAEFADSEKSKG